MLGFAYSAAETKRVKRMQFGVLSPEEIKAMSVCEITNPGTFNLGKPIKGGLNDPALGTCDKRSTCVTCKNTYAGSSTINDCPGHFGHVQLESPVFHIGFLNEVYKLVQCVCLNCSKLKVDRSDPEFARAKAIANGKKRLYAMMKLARSRKHCGGDSVVAPPPGVGGDAAPPPPPPDAPAAAARGCGAAQPKTFRRDGLRILIEYDDKDEDDVAGLGDRKQVLSPAKVYEVFRGVSDETARLLGLTAAWARPEWLVLTVLPVAPPHVRPSVAVTALIRSDDDVTHKYADIVKTNLELARAKRSARTAMEIEQFEALLQWHCATLIDNSLPGLPGATQRGGKALKTFRERLVGKGGRIRGNLMGKRVDFSARTVITADPNLSIHQVGVPRTIAANLTVPETVSRWNVRKLQALVARGWGEWPGAKYIIRDNGQRIDLRYAKGSDLTLKYGWVVERHLMDDDTVLFNRQPSLHKMSIMCHKAKVLDYSTFRLNLTCTTPYNADFDGDEMNLHALQTLPAIAEAAELMIVPRLIITPAANRPVMGIVQDTLLGARKMTQRDVFIEKDVLFNILLWMTPPAADAGWGRGRVPPPAVLVPTPGRPGRHRALWTGKQVVSMFTPDVNYVVGSDDPVATKLWAADEGVVIERGQLMCGITDKATLGNRGQGLLHIIMNDCTPEDARDFINNTQRCINYWFLHRGFSIGIGDSESDTKTMKNVSEIIAAAKVAVQGIVVKAQEGALKRQPGQSLMQSFEAVVNDCLKSARDDSAKQVLATLTENTNAVVGMVKAGSKGSDMNISQIIACVGQQNVDGKRIAYGFRDRTLPHFTKFDLGPQSRGFVENSYLKGLTPTEFFMHMMGGREGLIDTAVKTAETGYIQRRLVKAMEDVMVQYDGTVRNSGGEVIQFLYGEDGMDGRWIETQHFPSWEPSLPRLRAAYAWEPDAPDFGRAGPGREYFLDPEVARDMRENVDTRDACAREFERLERDRDVMHAAWAWARRVPDGARSYMPVAVERIITNVKKGRLAVRHDGVSDMHPVRDVIEPVAALIRRLVVVPNPGGRDALAGEAQSNATLLVSALLRSALASKVVIARHRLTRAAFSQVLGQVEERWFSSIASPGEMCGVIAAQSIGEPATQMTLNTFHSAGVGSKTVTQGVPRLKEIINIAKKCKTPSVTIFVRDEELKRNRDKAYLHLQKALEYTVLGDLLEETSIVYDPDPFTTVVEEDAELVLVAMAVPSTRTDPSALSPWVLRLRLSRDAFLKARISMRDIKAKIAAIDESLHIVESDDNADAPVLRIRLDNSGAIGGGGAGGAGGGGGGGGGGDGDDAPALAEGGGGGGLGGAPGGSSDEDVRTLRDFEAALQELKLRGVDHIRKLYSSVVKEKTWSPARGLDKPDFQEPKLETEGTNLAAVMNDPSVDHARTSSNSPVEIFEVLGIEACRQSLLNEIRNTFEGSSYINFRHLAMLVDSMTFRGYLTAVTRHGINRVDTGPLTRCSFEETCEILMDAAMFAEADDMGGVSGNIMLGQLGPMGTGAFDILLDDAMLKDALVLADTGAGGGAGGDALLAGWGAGGGGDAGATPLLTAGGATPGALGADGQAGGYSGYSPSMAMQFSPSGGWTADVGGGAGGGMMTPAGGMSPGGLGATSPGALYAAMYSPAPYLSGAAPGAGAASPGYGGAYGAGARSPSFTPTESGSRGGPAGSGGASPAYSPTSPAYSPTSPSGVGGVGGGARGGASPTSPAYSPASAGYSPTSPGAPAAAAARGGASPASQNYSPTSPAYSPASAGAGGGGAGAGGARGAARGAAAAAASPISPAYSPSAAGPSVGASPASPAYSPSSPALHSGGGYSPLSSSTGGAGAAGAGGAAGGARAGGARAGAPPPPPPPPPPAGAGGYSPQGEAPYSP